MERVPKMLNWISKDMEKAINNRKQNWQKLNTKPLKEKIQNFINNLNSIEDKKIVISYLKRSYILKNHKFKIAQYEDEAFLELYPKFEYLNAQSLFEDIDDDMRKMISQLSKDNKFIQIKPSEKEEIRRYYMEWLYVESEMVFKQIILELFSNSQAPPIYFGAELGEVKRLVDDN